MGFQTGLLLSFLLVFGAACSVPAAEAVLPTAPQLEAAPPPANLDPVSVGLQLLETKGGARWLEPPTPLVVQQMRYAEAHDWVPLLDEGQDELWSPDMSVWLVVFRARWQLAPFDPAQADPQPATYEGCSLVLFTAAGGDLIAMGDTACPGG